MFIHVSDVKYEGQYRLRVTFDDGVVKRVDLEKELEGAVFEPLRDLTQFRRVMVNKDTGTIEWPNGADMAPEFLYEIGKPTRPAQARKVAEDRAVYASRGTSKMREASRRNEKRG